MNPVFVGALALAVVGFQSAVAQAPPRLRLVEDLRIGSLADPRGRFSMVREVRPMADGSLALITALGSAWSVRVFDANGRHRWTRDFEPRQTPAGLAVSGDTLVVQSGIYESIQFLFFRVGSDEPFGVTEVFAERGQTTTLLGSLAGPPIVVTGTPNEPYGRFLAAVARVPYEFRTIAPNPAAPPFLRWVDSTPRAIVPATGRGMEGSRAIVLPWMPVPTFHAVRGEVVLATEAGFNLRLVGANGAVRRTIAIPIQARPLTDELIQTLFASWRTGPGRALPDSVLPAIRAVPPPPHFPVIGGVFASANGEFAVRRRDRQPDLTAPPDTAHFDVVGTNGAIRGSFALPAPFRFAAFSGTHVYATFSDSTRIAARSSERSQIALPLVQVARFRLESSR